MRALRLSFFPVSATTSPLPDTATPYMGILPHMYSGPLSCRIQLSGRQVVPIGELTEDILGDVKEDVIYEFRRSSP
jgi:hypothetical protein